MLVPWVSLVFNFLKISKLSTSSGFNWVNYHRLYDLRNQRPDNSEFRKQNVLGAGAPWASSLWCHHLPPPRVTTLLALESTGYICLCVTSFIRMDSPGPSSFPEASRLLCVSGDCSFSLLNIPKLVHLLYCSWTLDYFQFFL